MVVGGHALRDLFLAEEDCAPLVENSELMNQM
jgi:hypothetical protein